MPPTNPPPSDLEAENAFLREQLSALVARVQDCSKSEAQLEEAQRLARIGSFELDVATRQLTWSVQQFRTFGFEPAPSIDRVQVLTRIHPLDLTRHEGAVQRAITHGEAFAIDYRLILPTGDVRHVHTIGQPVLGPDGRVAKLVGTSQDVTQRVELEEQLRAQNEELRALHEIKDHFVDAVSHELRNPMTTIAGYADVLAEELDGPITPRQLTSIQQIKRGARRLQRLLDDLLEFTILQSGDFALQLAPARLDDQVREAVEGLRPQLAEASVAVELGLPAESLWLHMDALRIGQVLTNLIANAIKFSPGGGAIQVRACRLERGFRCEVQDRGPGIAAEDLPRLFQRYSQLGPGTRGAGLGLSISKALVEAHGGRIGVDSTPGAGSTFWFELPA
jgi:PAS domain S-box-containing protein